MGYLEPTMAADRSPGDFGSMLRAARERRGVSLRQIANSTKISVSMLDALEHNDISRLPGGIFSRAFVRSFAVEVGLDPEQTIQEFVAAFPADSVTAGHREGKPPEDNDAFESRKRTATTVLRMFVLGVPLAALFLYLGGARGATTPHPDVSVAAPTPDASPSPDTPPLGTTSTPVANVSRESAGPSAARGDGVATVSMPAAVASESERSDLLEVGLTIVRPCWISASVDGHKTIERLLNPGERPTFEVRHELMLTVGDGSAVAMTLNGIEARPIGKSGQVARARVSVANFRDFLASR
jgi:cytoskeleton protein RodZ